MPTFKPCNYDQMVTLAPAASAGVLPISLEAQLVPGSLEHTINEVVEKHIDLAVFDARYNNDETGASAIHPKILLKIILLAYARGLLSSRQMERACLENATFMALACGYTPDHSTIAAFVSSMQEEVKRVFCNVLLVCDQLGLLGGSHFSLDGVKLAANVSKEWSGTFEELKHKRDKMQQVMEERAGPSESQNRQRRRQENLCPAAGNCRAGVCEHLCSQTHEPLHPALKKQGGCTMEIVRNGAQYRENLRFWALK